MSEKKPRDPRLGVGARFTRAETEQLRPIAAFVYRALRDAEEGSLDQRELIQRARAELGVAGTDVLRAVLWMRGHGVQVVVARPRSAPESGWSRMALRERLPESWDALL